MVAREVARQEVLEGVLDQLLFEESRLVYPPFLVLKAVQVQSFFAFLALLDSQPVLRRRSWRLVLPLPPPVVLASKCGGRSGVMSVVVLVGCTVSLARMEVV